ncbi:MAG: hypothetical protein H7338_02790 [Candidatus Sericytochromatia bacterium]|nr:hypothetical protein [Candidatus Sericytochromatia bacterium]
MASIAVPAEVWSLVCNHLTSSHSGADGASHFDTYAASALLIAGAQVVPATTLDRQQYAQGRSGMPGRGPEFDPVHPVAWAADDDGGTLLLIVQERQTWERFQAAVRLSGPPWGVLGSWVEPGDLPPPAIALSRALAELAAWSSRAYTGIWADIGLGASFLRLRPDSGEALLALPEARFTCQNSQRCCSNETWGIPVSANSRLALAAMPFPTLGLTPPTVTAWEGDFKVDSGVTRAFPYRLSPEPGGTCAACDGRGCSVHAAIGWQPLITCQLFPYMFTETPDGVCVSRSFTCPTVIANIGGTLAEQEGDVRQRLMPIRHTLPRVDGPVRLSPEGGVVLWSAYRRLEDHLLDLLADMSLGSVDERLLAGHRLLVMLVATVRGETRVDDGDIGRLLAGERAPRVTVGRGLADTLMANMMAGPPNDDHGEMLGGGRLEAWRAGEGQPLGEALAEDLLVRYLREVLFRKRSVGIAGVAFQWGMLAWINRIWQRDAVYRALRQGRLVDLAIQRETVSAIDIALVNRDVQTSLAQNPYVVAQLSTPYVWLSFGIP